MPGAAVLNPLLQVSYERTAPADVLAGNDVLAVFEFGTSPLSSTDPRHVPVALPPLSDSPPIEIWRTPGPVECGTAAGFRFARSDQLTMAQLALDLREFTGMRSAARHAYESMQEFLAGSQHHCPLKIWNYVPGINVGNGDDEHYRQFCVGRAEALSPDPGDHAPMPAATAIGTPEGEPALQLYMLAGGRPGLNVENPRQVNAWRYPRQYSPKSPLFSRGTIITLNGDRQFLISGTASVVGHETHHDTAEDQIGESVRNVESLLSEARRLTAVEDASRAEGVIKVYVRKSSDLSVVREWLDASSLAQLPAIYLQGDVCRADLLTELDGIVSL